MWNVEGVTQTFFGKLCWWMHINNDSSARLAFATGLICFCFLKIATCFSLFYHQYLEIGDFIWKFIIYFIKGKQKPWKEIFTKQVSEVWFNRSKCNIPKLWQKTRVIYIQPFPDKIKIIHTFQSSEGSLMNTSIVLISSSWFCLRARKVCTMLLCNMPSCLKGSMRFINWRVRRKGISSGTGRNCG